MLKKTNILIVCMLIFFVGFSCDSTSSSSSETLPENPTETDTDAEDPSPNPPASGTMVSLHGQLRIEGTNIVDKNNEVVQLRGMSLFWSQWMGQ